MKTQTCRSHFFTGFCGSVNLLSAGIIIALCLFSVQSFSQAVDIVSPVSRISYKLADPSGMQTAADLQAAVTTAETAGKALNAEAAKEIALKSNDANKAKALNDGYIAALSNFNKNDVIPYNTDLNNYTASGTKFNETLAAYNKAALANNALAAKDRKAATVAALNKQKMQLDAWGIKLTQWKNKLDAAKAGLDTKNAALQKQKQNADAASLAVAGKSKAIKMMLNGLLDQMTLCANYAAKCHTILVSKFNGPNTTDIGYFSSTIYRSAIAALVTAMRN